MKVGHGTLHWLLVLANLIVGLLAAHYWLKASKIKIDPGWRTGLPRSAADARRPIEPGDAQLSQMCSLTATMTAAAESADLNRVAAILTAITVGLSALLSTLSNI